MTATTLLLQPETTAVLAEPALTVVLAEGSNEASLAEIEHAVEVVVQDVLAVELASGHEGGCTPCSGGYTHMQNEAASEWTINHNLGYRPAVELMTPGGLEFEAAVQHLDDNQVRVQLAIAMAGSARLN